MNGKMSLHLVPNGPYFTVAGGAYLKKPAHYVGVNCAADIDAPAAVSLPIPDFNVPSQKDAARAVKKTMTLILLGKPVYVGCGWGQGRTGLFLSLLAKSFGVVDPVAFVRKNYYPKAVETPQQKAFVEAFEIPVGVRLRLTLARLWYTWARGDLTKPV